MKSFFIALAICFTMSEARAGQQTDAELQQKAATMAEWVRSYVKEKSGSLPNDIMLRVGGRLAQCGAMSSIAAKNFSSSEADAARKKEESALFTYASGEIYPGGQPYLLMDMKKWLDQLLAIKQSQRSLFHLIRNCQDFMDRSRTEDAVLELAFDK
jgi:hypothetical protein